MPAIPSTVLLVFETGKSDFVSNANTPPLLVFFNTDMVADTVLLTIRSGNPSPVRSAVASVKGLFPAAKFHIPVKERATLSEVFLKIETLPEIELGIATSGLPSLLKSAITKG